MSHRLRKRYGHAHIDEHAVNELDLYIENTGEMYPAKKAILARIRAGTPSTAALWAPWVAEGARRYQKEIGRKHFSKAVQAAVAGQLAEHYKTGEG